MLTQNENPAKCHFAGTRNTPAECELLAPAGDILSFEAAIACGADAVYLGLSDFNARRKADNFTVENLRRCVKKAHFFGVKIYLTVNTLVKDGEFKELLSLVRSAVEARVDAYIVQDLGVALCLKRAFPNIVLHASTQLGVHNLYGAKQAEKFGFKRVVLSRETKLEDIRAIREGTELEIEYFVQGALCVAFSGNCYLSAKECGASGNRGLCKQLCRLPYKAELGEKTAEGYLLSAKDLCLASSLEDLIAAGVTSFKIEGRMRRASYVGSAVKVYREILDGLKSDEIKDKRPEVKYKGDDTDFIRSKTLRIAYSRGEDYLERAYLDEGTPFVIEKQFNNHTGVRIGEVRQVKRFKTDLYEVTVSSDCELNAGDGLKFFGAERTGASGAKAAGSLKEVASVGLGDVKKVGAGLYSFVTKTQIKRGWQINIISSQAQNDEIKNACRKVDIDFEVYAVAGEPLKIKASCDIGTKTVSVEVAGDICQRAINAPMDLNALTAQVGKVGGSGFAVRSVRAVNKDAFVPKSTFNALRREVVSKMTDALISEREKHLAEVDEKAVEEILNDNSKIANTSRKLRFIHSGELKNGKVIITDVRELAVICPSEYNVKEINGILDGLGLSADKAALRLPIIANAQDLKVIEKLLGEMKGIKTLVSENIYGFEFANRGYKVIAGAGHNAFNRFAYAALSGLGASEVLPGVESRETRCDGELPLMTFAHCPYKTLFGNDCAHCTFKEGLILSREKRRYRVVRTKVHNCYFALFEK